VSDGRSRHDAGRIHELTGPRALTFTGATALIAAARWDSSAMRDCRAS